MDHPGGSSHRTLDFDSTGLSAVEGENMDVTPTVTQWTWI